MGLPLSLYHLFGPLFFEVARKGASLDGMPARPPGILIWLHAPRAEDAEIVQDIVAHLSDRYPDAWFLVTDEGTAKGRTQDQCFRLSLPPDRLDTCRRFVAHWRPDLVAWIAPSLRPAIIAATFEQEVPIFLLDSGNAVQVTQGLRLFPGLVKTTLRMFSGVLSGDEMTSRVLVDAGADMFLVETVGVLERTPPPPRCNEAEWEELAALLATRPVWLAAGIPPGELGAVIAAHKKALRRSHRLLLILVPQDPDDTYDAEHALTDANLAFTKRSDGGEPDGECEVYLADTEDELGLWYRLSFATYMGGTLNPAEDACANPLGAASLGSIVIHGDYRAPYEEAFNRLERAGASISVDSSTDIAAALDLLLAPDKTAERAHAGWQVCSSGAEAMDHVLSIIEQTVEIGQRK